MVHTGRPSRGCGVCRKRRIKCDEKTPECSYCIKTNKRCPGYKHQFDLAWRDQNTAAKNSVQRRKKGYEAQMASELPCISHSSSHSTAISLRAPSIPLRLVEQPENHYLGFFFSTYANPPSSTEETRGFLDYLEPLYILTGSSSTLSLSTMAVSAYLFTAWQNRGSDNAISRSLYLQAISSMKSHISIGVYCDENDLLMSVLLLQMYERLDRTVKQESSPTRAHLAGALALIKHHGLSSFNQPISQGLLLSVRNQLVQEAFSTSNPCVKEIEQWGYQCRNLAQTPTLLLDDINVSLAATQAAISAIAARSWVCDSEFRESLVVEAHTLEERLLKWKASLPISWNFVSVGISNIPISVQKAGLYQSNCSIYSSISAASGWNKYRVSMMKVQKIIFHLSADNPSFQSASMNFIQSLADDICGSIPFILGDRMKPGSIGDRTVQYPYIDGQPVPQNHYWMAPAVGGFNLVDGFGGPQSLSPLGEVLFTEGLRNGQREWVGGQLKRIAKIYNGR